MKKFFLSFGFLLLNAGCVNFLPPPPPRPQNVPLTIAYRKLPEVPTVDWSLAIENPLACSVIDSKRLIVHTKDQQQMADLQPLEGIEWSDRLSTLVLQKIVSAFEYTDKIMAVGQIDEDFHADYTLQIDIKTAEIDLTSAAHDPKARFELSAKLIRQEDRQIVARRTFYQTTAVADRSQYHFVQAYTQALENIIHQIIFWTLKTGVVVSSKKPLI